VVPSLWMVEPWLDQVRSKILDLARTETPFVTNLAEHALLARGQMLRPSLLLASSLLGGASEPCPEAISLGVIVELIHCASLLHDDVVDKSRIRRRLITVNAKWGNKEAVLLGDFVLARAIRCLCKVPDPKVLASIERITYSLSVGQLMELEQSGNIDLDEDSYLRIISHKTARFFAECAYLGGWTAGLDDDALTHVSSFGLSLGMSYQILDDLLDILGSAPGMGKDTTHDAANGNVTLPVIWLLRSALPSQRDRVIEALNARDLTFLRDNLVRHVADGGARAYCIEKARSYSAQAKSEIDALSARCPSTIERALTEVLGYVFARVDAGGDASLAAAKAAES